MSKRTRHYGKTIRKVAKLDRRWRLEGQRRGRVENELAYTLGTAYRLGLGRKARRAQNRSAARLGQRSGWENLLY